MIKIFKKYSLEKDMCDELSAHMKDSGWIVYPEQGGWDLLLVRRNIQIGVQAKLRPTIKLLSQALISEQVSGPHYRAVAVGNSQEEEKEDFAKISMALRLIYIDMGIHPDYWFYKATQRVSLKYYRHFPNNIVWTPPYVPELDAGIPSPKTVSPWKIAAIKMELIAETKGWVSIIDAREVVRQEVPIEKKGSYPRTLLQSFFVRTKEKDPRNTRCSKWVMGRKRYRPSDKFKDVFEALKGKKNA